jgi:hypothetical protein
VEYNSATTKIRAANRAMVSVVTVLSKVFPHSLFSSRTIAMHNNAAGGIIDQS